MAYLLSGIAGIQHAIKRHSHDLSNGYSLANFDGVFISSVLRQMNRKRQMTLILSLKSATLLDYHGPV